jgi:hypothetical protein
MSGLIQTERIFYYAGFQFVAARPISCTSLRAIEFMLASERAIATKHVFVCFSDITQPG